MLQNVRVCGFAAMIEELEKGKMAWRKWSRNGRKKPIK
jgi:hypothetical protein